MVIYIKINDDNTVQLGGTLPMEGYVPYDGEIPKASVLKWDQDTESIIGDLTLDKEVKIKEINEVYNKVMDNLIEQYPERETATWDKQLSEAKAYKNDPSTPIPFLTSLSTARAVPLDVLVDRILTKAEQYAIASGWYTGLRQKYEDMVASATTYEEIEDITPIFELSQIPAS